MTADDGRQSAEDLAYRARALAQAHPMTPLAKRYLDEAVAQQRTSQPIPEIGMWAAAAGLNGYCVRRVEESEAGVVLVPDSAHEPELAALDETTTRVADGLRDEDADLGALGVGLGGAPVEDAVVDRTVEALDRVISSEVSRRLQNWSDEVDEKAWAELEEYLAWWVIRGYALRVAESSIGALTPGGAG